MFVQKTDKKVAIFLADGTEMIEALTPVDLLFRAGIPVSTVAVSDKPLIRSSHDTLIVTDMTVDEVHFDDYDMLVLPGGMPGTVNLENCEALKDAVVRFHNEGKQLAAICAAPTILAHLGLLKGHPATCHTVRMDELAEYGADVKKDPVVVTDNMILSRGVGTAIDFSLAIIAHYLGEEAAQKVADSIVYPCKAE